MPAEDGLSCGSQNSYFPWNGTGSAPGYWAQDWSGAIACQPATYQTQYSISARDDYKRCVCDLFGEGEADCADNGETDDSNHNDGDEFIPDEEEEEEEEEEQHDHDHDHNAIDHFAELAEIRANPHYQDDSYSRTMYQVDREMDFVEHKILEMYIAMHDAGLLQ